MRRIKHKYFDIIEHQTDFEYSPYMHLLDSGKFVIFPDTVMPANGR